MINSLARLAEDGESRRVPKIIKKVIPAVVSITVSKYLEHTQDPFSFHGFEEFFRAPERKKVQIGGGSGFIIAPNGIILTNRHVVADPEADYIVVLNPTEENAVEGVEKEKKYKAEILAKDPINDCAILKIKTENLPVIELGDSSKLELGQSVIAIGNTLGIFRNTVSTGVISGLSRYITAFDGFNRRAQQLRGLIQTDAAINPGNSGGPLINLEGKVIGINAAMVFGAENIGFALPINAAKNVISEVKKYGRLRQPFLGVRYILLDKTLQKKYNLPTNYGALVVAEDAEGKAVIPGSPAYVAGVRESDIILEISGTETDSFGRIKKEKISSQNPLEDILQKFKVDQIINLKILRKGREIICQTKIEERK